MLNWFKAPARRQRRAAARLEQYLTDGERAEQVDNYLSADEFAAGVKLRPQGRALLDRYLPVIRRKLAHTAHLGQGASFLSAYLRLDGTCYVVYWIWKDPNTWHGMTPFYFPEENELRDSMVTVEQIAVASLEPDEPMDPISSTQVRALSASMNLSLRQSQFLAQLDSGVVAQLGARDMRLRRHAVLIPK